MSAALLPVCVVLKQMPLSTVHSVQAGRVREIYICGRGWQEERKKGGSGRHGKIAKRGVKSGGGGLQCSSGTHTSHEVLWCVKSKRKYVCMPDKTRAYERHAVHRCRHVCLFPHFVSGTPHRRIHTATRHAVCSKMPGV